MFRWPGQNLQDSLNTSSHILKSVYLDVVTVPFFLGTPIFRETKAALRSCCLGLEIITTKKLLEDHFLSGILLELTMVYQPSRYDIL